MGKAWDLGPWLVRADRLVPVKDTSANSIFQGHVAYRLVEEPHTEVQPAEQVEAELVNSSEADVEQGW